MLANRIDQTFSFLDYPETSGRKVQEKWIWEASEDRRIWQHAHMI